MFPSPRQALPTAIPRAYVVAPDPPWGLVGYSVGLLLPLPAFPTTQFTFTSPSGRCCPRAQHIPDDMDFISDKMIWRNRETGDELAADSTVRLRVLRAKTDVGRTSAVGTIADACLGVITAE